MIACRIKTATTRFGREKIEHEGGMRYSELVRLPYLNIVRCHLVDPLRNLNWRTSKQLLQLCKEKKYLNDSVFDKLQEVMNPSIHLLVLVVFCTKYQQVWLDLQLNSGCCRQSCILPLFFVNCFHFQKHVHFSAGHTFMKWRWIKQMNYLLLSFCTGFEQLYG